MDIGGCDRSFNLSLQVFSYLHRHLVQKDSEVKEFKATMKVAGEGVFNILAAVTDEYMVTVVADLS